MTKADDWVRAGWEDKEEEGREWFADEDWSQDDQAYVEEFMNYVWDEE